MILCVPVTGTGEVDPRWGRAGRVAVAEVVGGTVRRWDEFDVAWDRLHDEGSEEATTPGSPASCRSTVRRSWSPTIWAIPWSRCWAGWTSASSSGSVATRVWLSWPPRRGSPDIGCQGVRRPRPSARRPCAGCASPPRDVLQRDWLWKAAGVVDIWVDHAALLQARSG